MRLFRVQGEKIVIIHCETPKVAFEQFNLRVQPVYLSKKAGYPILLNKAENPNSWKVLSFSPMSMNSVSTL